MICRAATIERLMTEGMSKRDAEIAVFDGVIPPDEQATLPCGCCSHCGCSC
jgi:hypothetical protein